VRGLGGPQGLLWCSGACILWRLIGQVSPPSSASCQTHVGRSLHLPCRWIKFFGVLAFLTIALMPLPSVHVTLVAGG